MMLADNVLSVAMLAACGDQRVKTQAKAATMSNTITFWINIIKDYYLKGFNMTLTANQIDHHMMLLTWHSRPYKMIEMEESIIALDQAGCDIEGFGEYLQDYCKEKNLNPFMRNFNLRARAMEHIIDKAYRSFDSDDDLIIKNALCNRVAFAIFIPQGIGRDELKKVHACLIKFSPSNRNKAWQWLAEFCKSESKIFEEEA